MGLSQSTFITTLLATLAIAPLLPTGCDGGRWLVGLMPAVVENLPPNAKAHEWTKRDG